MEGKGKGKGEGKEKEKEKGKEKEEEMVHIQPELKYLSFETYPILCESTKILNRH